MLERWLATLPSVSAILKHEDLATSGGGLAQEARAGQAEGGDQPDGSSGAVVREDEEHLQVGEGGQPSNSPATLFGQRVRLVHQGQRLCRI